MTIEVQIERTEDGIEGDKRQYAPFVTKWTCPGCGAANELDHTSDYFSYPVFGEPKVFELHCRECEKEQGSVQLVLDLTLKVAP